MTLVQFQRRETITYTFAHLTTTILIKSGIGFLNTVTINGVSVAGTLTIYDGTDATGSIMAIITLAVNPTPFTLHYETELTTGLYVTFTGGLTADITFSYR